MKKVQKRNGLVVDFSLFKIHDVLTKAFSAVKHENSLLESLDEDIINQISGLIVERIDLMHDKNQFHVEEIQDIVEQVLLQQNLYKIGRAYILYREEHRKIREEKKKGIVSKIQRGEMLIEKSNGEKVIFKKEKLKEFLLHHSNGFVSNINIDLVISHVIPEISNNMNTSSILKILIYHTRSFIEKDPSYSQLTSNILMHMIYKSVLGNDYNEQDFETLYKNTFYKNIKHGVASNILDKRILNLDIDAIANYITPHKDKLLLYLGLQTLEDRYLMKDGDQLIETPQMLWMRIAMGLSLLEKSNTTVCVRNFYDVMSDLLYIPSTPTLFHASLIRSQLSSCYINTIQDSLNDIFKVIKDNANMSKWSGGIGTDWTNLRGTGAKIHSTGVSTQGIVPFLKIANDATAAINRSGRRRGATCCYLEIWHIDIESFIELRKNTGDERRRTHDINIAAWVPDLFMIRVKEDGMWTLFSPDETPELHRVYGKEFKSIYESYEDKAAKGKIALFRRIKAKELWKKTLTMLYETGHPWITFKDACNIRSTQDHVGRIFSSNLCTEITLNSSAEETAVCNLGSINLKNHMFNNAVSWDKLKQTVVTAMRMLDNIIDINFYPTIEAKKSNTRHRAVGLGLMGLQDALFIKNLEFDSQEAINFSSKVQEFISYHAILTSSQLARNRGKYESYEGSKWSKKILPYDTLNMLAEERGCPIDVPKNKKLNWNKVLDSIEKYGMRNSNCLSIAPTATIANIAGCYPCIEPMYKNLYVKSNASGNFIIINSYLVQDLKKINLWNDNIIEKIKFYDGILKHIEEIPSSLKYMYRGCFEIHYKPYIDMVAQRGIWIDQSQSVNLFFNGNSGKGLSDMYLYAWEKGLKTTYYLRSLAISQVEKSTSNPLFGKTTYKREMDNPSCPTNPSSQEDQICEACQ